MRLARQMRFRRLQDRLAGGSVLLICDDFENWPEIVYFYRRAFRHELSSASESKSEITALFATNVRLIQNTCAYSGKCGDLPQSRKLKRKRFRSKTHETMKRMWVE